MKLAAVQIGRAHQPDARCSSAAKAHGSLLMCYAGPTGCLARLHVLHQSPCQSRSVGLPASRKGSQSPRAPCLWQQDNLGGGLLHTDLAATTLFARRRARSTRTLASPGAAPTAVLAHDVLPGAPLPPVPRSPSLTCGRRFARRHRTSPRCSRWSVP